MSEPDLQSDAVAERNFHAKLLQIDGDLHQADIQALKFLFKDSLQKSKLAKISSGHELFTGLETSKLISAKDPSLLVEVFKTIGRLDLIDYLDIDENMADGRKTGKISDYRHMMFEIAQDLTKEDTSKLAFLAEKISKAKHEKLTSALDLFDLMEELMAISPTRLDKLYHYMMSLNRKDLVGRLERFCGDEKGGIITGHHPPEGPKRMTECGIGLKPVLMEMSGTTESTQTDRKNTVNGLPRSVILDLSQELNSQQGSQIKALWKQLGYTEEYLVRISEAMKHHKNDFTIQTMLDSAPLLHGVDMTQALIKFINALRFADMLPLSRQLVAKFKDCLPREYLVDVERHRQEEENKNMQVSMGEASQLCNSPETANDTGLSSGLFKDSDTTNMFQTYKMEANPRGICVIFNNTKFKYDRSPEAEQLKDRVGSDIDAEKLCDVFRKLHFIVVRHDNLPAAQMCHLLEEISCETVTDEHDCFVCCVLTHGKMGDKVYGCDGRLVDISVLQNPFKATRCPQLAGKPKLFFIQACQGQEKQEGIKVQSDMTMETDGPQQLPTVPNEADFLIGYATAPGFVSYRSKSQGSWYISILTDQLDRLATTCDLLSILTKVNHEVGKKQADIDGMQYKQSPAPQYTLRKKVIFQRLPSKFYT